MKAYAISWLFFLFQILQSAIHDIVSRPSCSSTIEEQLSELETARTCFVYCFAKKNGAILNNWWFIRLEIINEINNSRKFF